MKLLSKVALLTLGLALASTVSYADTVTLTLTGTGGASNGADYLYPYYFSVNGSTTQTSLMCVSFDNEVYNGETWTATTSTITTASSVTAQEDAYLFSLIGNSSYSINDIQEAAWYLSATNPSSVPTTADDTTLLTAALSAVTAADLGGPAAFDDGQFDLYTPVAGSQPDCDGTPQSFVGDPPVPEPNTLLLMATGLLSCIGLLYNRRRATL